MSDSQQHADTQNMTQGDAAAVGPTAGTLLREAREAAGLHIAALAVSLKVPVRKLEALEADRLDLLPDAVFVRALASSVCRTLKMDPAPVLERLPQTAAPRLMRDTGGINTPFRAPSDGRNPSWIDQLSKPVFLAVFALLLGALVLIFLPSARQDEVAAPAKAEVTSAPVPVPVPTPVMPPVAAPEPVPAVKAVVAPPAAPPAQPTAVVSAGRAAAPVPAVSPTFSVAVSTPTVVSPTAVVTPAAALPTTGIVVFKTQGESWVEVTDAKGVIAVRKTLAPGEVVGASGALPLAVVIGRANATRVEVRGRPFDLNAVAKDNVARFEVK